MENAAEALIMAFGVFALIIALSVSISLLGQANDCSEAILGYIDRENDYIYIENTEDTERKVGLETIIPTIYRTEHENYRIEFYKSDGNKFELYKYDTNENGSEDSEDEIINIIDLKNENWTDKNEFVKKLIYGELEVTENNNDYSKYFFPDSSNALYYKLKDQKVTEYLGEYYEEDLKETQDNSISDINKNKTRVIVYVVE